MSSNKLLEPHLTQKDGRFFITSVKLKEFVDGNEILRIENAMLLEELRKERLVTDMAARDLPNQALELARETQKNRKVDV